MSLEGSVINEDSKVEIREEKKSAAIEAYKIYLAAKARFEGTQSDADKNAVNVAVSTYREAVAAADVVGVGEGEIMMEAKK